MQTRKFRSCFTSGMEVNEFDTRHGDHRRTGPVHEELYPYEAARKQDHDDDKTARRRRAAITPAQFNTVDSGSSSSKSSPWPTSRHAVFDTLTEWIDGAIVQTTAHNRNGKADETSTGFAWSLYHHNLKLFSLLLPLTMAWSVPKYDKQQEKSLKRSLGRLFIWGDGFQCGKLETVLDESEGLRETVIESLAAIGNILVSSMFIFYSRLLFDAESQL